MLYSHLQDLTQGLPSPIFSTPSLSYSPMETSIVSKPRRLVTLISGGAIIAISLSVLVGWVLDIALLKSVLPNFPDMKPNTALAFVIFGTGLFCAARFGSTRVINWLVTVCGLLVCLIGLLSLAEHQFGADLGIDTILISAARFQPDDALPGRMSPQSAFNFLLLGLSLAMLRSRWHLHWVTELLVGIVSITTFGAILGHLFGAQQMYGVTNYTSMALHTTVLFLLGSSTLLASNPQSRVVNLLTSKSLAGTTALKLLPAVILVPTFVDWVRVIGQQWGLYDTGFGSAVTIEVRVILEVGIVLFICFALLKADAKRKQIEQELGEKEQRYRELFDYGQSMICIHDLEGFLTTVNPAALNSIGYDREEVIGKNLCEFMPEELRPQFPAFLRRIENEGIANGTFALVAKNGKSLMWQYQSIMVSEPGQEPYVLGNAQDITKLVEATNQLKNLSLTDDLTGLNNRRGFQTLAEQQIRLERHLGTARGLRLMFADLDGLKRINDQYGHEAGSLAIRAFADVLRSTLRSADIVARWGGDEFVILTIGSLDETAEMIVDRIHKRVAHHNAESDAPYDLACSIGVTSVPVDGGQSFESLIAEADAAMYSEKRLRKLASIAPQPILRL